MVLCQVCAAFALPSVPPAPAPEADAEPALFCHRCGVALEQGDRLSPVLWRLALLARFGLAGPIGASRGSTPPQG